MSEPTIVTAPGALSIQMSSGVAAPDPANQPAALATSSVVGGATRVTVRDGASSIQQGGFATHNSGNSPSGNATAPAVIKSPLGSIRSGVDVKPTDVVSLRSGVQTSVAAAKAVGWLSQNAMGEWIESFSDEGDVSDQASATTPEKAISEATGEAQAEPIARLDEPSEAIMTDFVGKVGSGDMAHGLQALIDTGSIPDDLAARAGSRLGVEAEQVRGQVQAVRASFERQAQEAVGEPVLAWARSARLAELKAAAREQVVSGTLSGYTKLAKSYMENLANIDPGAIMNSKDAKARGISRDANGTITVDLGPGIGKVEWSAAVRAGLVGPKFPGKSPSQPTAAPIKAYPAPHASDLAALKRNPSPQNRTNFDSHYGIGAAARHLGT